MSTFQQRFDAAARLALLSRNAANLNRRLSELNRLRDRVRQAELFARKSQRTSLRKRIRQIRHMVKAAWAGGLISSWIARLFILSAA